MNYCFLFFYEHRAFQCFDARFNIDDFPVRFSEWFVNCSTLALVAKYKFLVAQKNEYERRDESKLTPLFAIVGPSIVICKQKT